MSDTLKIGLAIAAAWWFWPSISPYLGGGSDLDFQVLLGNINNEWRRILPSYRKPRLVIYDGTTRAGCGGQADSRFPFFCPEDGAIYLSPAFVRQIPCSGKACEFGLATVLAHEVGHAVQDQLGLLGDRGGPSVELQADCLAGLWAKHEDVRLRKEGKPPLVEPGDIEAAMRMAGAFGGGNGSHGSGQQRQASFYRGWTRGTLAACTGGRSA